MPTFSQLPSGKWRVQVRRGGAYKAATFERKREAEDWAREIESQTKLVAIKGFTPPPKGASLADLFDRCRELHGKQPGRSKAATLDMLKADTIGAVKLSALSALTFRDFVDRRVARGGAA